MWSILELRRNDLHTGDAKYWHEGGGGGMGHLSSKSRPGKSYKISVQMMLPIRIDKSMWTIYDNSHGNVYVPFKVE